MTETEQPEQPKAEPEQPKRKRGRPPRYAAAGTRQNFSFRITPQMRARLIAAVKESGRSLSEEIEYRLERDLNWEALKGDINAMFREAAAIKSRAYVEALRMAGLSILRDVEGRPARVVVDLETLVAEADGISRGLRSGFTDDKADTAPAPAPTPTPSRAARQRAAEEEAKAMREVDELRARIRAMQEHAAKNGEPDGEAT